MVQENCTLNRGICCLPLELVHPSSSPEGQNTPYGIFQLSLYYKIKRRALLRRLVVAKRVVWDSMSVSTACCGAWDLLISFERNEASHPTEAVYAIVGDSLERSSKRRPTTAVPGDLSNLVDPSLEENYSHMTIQPTGIFKYGLGEIMTLGFVCVECKGTTCSVQRK